MLDKSTERILKRMDRMGFAGAGEALKEIDLLRSQLAMAHAETLEWIEKYNECEKPDERDAEIERLRGQVDEAAIHVPAHAAIEIERLRCALEAISVVPVGEGSAGSMRKIAVQALRVREALGE